MILAVVPARGGSKRLPCKNIVPFGGRPLLGWSVAMANALGSDIHCVVSTEDAQIAAVSRAAGAEVVDRPAALSGDDSSPIDVLVHAAAHVRGEGLEFEGVMLLQPTNPLRPVDMVRRAIGRFLKEPCESLMAVSRRQLKFGKVKDGYFVPDYEVGTQSRRTDPVFHENGWLYLTKTATLMDHHSLTGDRILAFETERPFDEVDIDEPVDLVVGEAILAAVRHRIHY